MFTADQSPKPLMLNSNTTSNADSGNASDQYVDLGDFPLALGGHLPGAKLAYITQGQLNSARDNAILILHGYTSSHRFILNNDLDNAEGSWGPLIGRGCSIDTDRYFVVAPNALGSSYGSTGPGDLNPSTGRPWGPDFPELTMADQVKAQSELLRTLGVDRPLAVIGLSMGGFEAFQWAVQYPDNVDKVVAVLTAPWGALNQAASQQSVTAVLQANAAWQKGWYYDRLSDMQQSLIQIRHKTLERYGVPAWLQVHYQNANQVQDKLDQMATHWAKRFDANALLTLRSAINRFDVRDQLCNAKAELMYVLCRTDSLFPPDIAQDTLSRWPQSAAAPTYVEIDSNYGHFASSLDWHKWAPALKLFLDKR